MGTYLNQIFSFMGVRFIAVGDHYDSREDNGIAIELDIAFKTLLYELYSKDISVKIKASFENKCANGEYVFSLAVLPKSSTQIARQLCSEGIPTIMQMRRPDKYARDGKAHAWSAQAVRNILNNRFYIGEMTYGRRTGKSVGSKKRIMLPKEEWKVIPNHYEPLVTLEVYEQVSVFHPDNHTKRKREKHPLTGKLYCGGCRYEEDHPVFPYEGAYTGISEYIY